MTQKKRPKTNKQKFQQEDIEVTSLDTWWQNANKAEIDLVLLKSDNSESLSKIILGGKNFFSQKSPLVLLPVLQDEAMNNPASQKLSEYGFEFYQYIPGANLLLKFDSGSQFLPSGLFAVRPHKTAELELKGLIGSHQTNLQEPDTTLWKKYLFQLPWTFVFSDWEQNTSKQENQQY